MIRRIIILDIALVILLAFGIMKFREDWLAFAPAHDVSAIQPKPEAVPALPSSAAGAATAASDWTEIPTLNPFSFDRNDIAVLAPAEPPKPVGPRPILYGTMMLGKGWMAMLASAQGNNRNSRPIRVGESMDGWTVVDIADKTVVVEANSNRETLSMDPTQVVPREYTRTGAAASPPVQSVAAPAATVVTPTPPTSAAPPANTAAPGAPRMCDFQTPFGIAKRPCEDR